MDRDGRQRVSVAGIAAVFECCAEGFVGDGVSFKASRAGSLPQGSRTPCGSEPARE
ncbi:hypothetical protein D3C87_2133370 [compost metagenome]